MNNGANINISTRTAIRYLAIIAIFLLGAHMIGLVFKFFLGHDHVFGLVCYFNFDNEMNPPTLFSTGLFLINAVLFLMIWKAEIDGSFNPKRWWVFLAGLFCFLALDEFSSLHERLIFPIKHALGIGGYFNFAWVIPYGIATIILGIFIRPFIRSLDRHSQLWLTLSALTYVAGAIGLEMIGGNYLESLALAGKKSDLIYALIVTLEESLEITGLIMLSYTLLSIIQHVHGGFKILVNVPR